MSTDGPYQGHPDVDQWEDRRTSRDPDGDLPAASIQEDYSGALVRESSGESFPLGPETIIGRHPSADLQIDDPSVSRQHARITAFHGAYAIEDLGSSNGTQVNGQDITDPVTLRPGDTVTVGLVDLRFEGEAIDMQEPVNLESTLFDPGAWAALRDATDEVISPTVEQADSHTETAPAVVDEPLPAAIEEIDASPGLQETLGETLATVQRLTELIRTLEAQTRDADATRRAAEDDARRREAAQQAAEEQLMRSDAALHDAEEQLRRSENDRKALSDRVRRVVVDMPGRSMPRDELTALQDSLDAVITNSRNPDNLALLARQAPNLADVLDEYTQLRRSVDRLAAVLSEDHSAR